MHQSTPNHATTLDDSCLPQLHVISWRRSVFLIVFKHTSFKTPSVGVFWVDLCCFRRCFETSGFECTKRCFETNGAVNASVNSKSCNNTRWQLFTSTPSHFMEALCVSYRFRTHRFQNTICGRFWGVDLGCFRQCFETSGLECTELNVFSTRNIIPIIVSGLVSCVTLNFNSCFNP